MKIEIRQSSGSVQGVDEQAKTAHLRLVTYNRADTYGSTWLPGVFDESLRTGHIPAVWSHDKSQIFGSVREHDIQPTHVDVNVAFADLDAVPLARTAYSLMKDGHIRDTSFGFSRVPGGTVSKRSDPNFEPSQAGERERMAKADLVEVSAVIKGSVPGNGVLGVRSVDGDQLHLSEREIFDAVAEGRIDVREALRALEEGQPVVLDRDAVGVGSFPGATATPPQYILTNLIAKRAPHVYAPSASSGSACAICGGAQDAKVHTNDRAVAVELASVPVREDDSRVLTQAADAAVDAALELLAGEALSQRGASALGLLFAADAALDRCQDLLKLSDDDSPTGPVGTLVATFGRAAAPTPVEVAVEDDDVSRQLDRVLSRQSGYGVRADAKMPYGDVTYADPGYQSDKKKRYPIDTEAHVRAAWTYINQSDNAGQYTADQLASIKSRIKAAGKKYGIQFSDN